MSATFPVSGRFRGFFIGAGPASSFCPEYLQIEVEIYFYRRLSVLMSINKPCVAPYASEQPVRNARIEMGSFDPNPCRACHVTLHEPTDARSAPKRQIPPMAPSEKSRSAHQRSQRRGLVRLELQHVAQERMHSGGERRPDHLANDDQVTLNRSLLIAPAHPLRDFRPDHRSRTGKQAENQIESRERVEPEHAAHRRHIQRHGQAAERPADDPP